MAQAIEQIIARWDSDEGKPYKGHLIDVSAYAAAAGVAVVAAAAAPAAARAAAGAAAASTNEIQGTSIMRERGQPFFFLPIFGFAAPEEIAPRVGGVG